MKYGCKGWLTSKLHSHLVFHCPSWMSHATHFQLFLSIALSWTWMTLLPTELHRTLLFGFQKAGLSCNWNVVQSRQVKPRRKCIPYELVSSSSTGFVVYHFNSCSFLLFTFVSPLFHDVGLKHYEGQMGLVPCTLLTVPRGIWSILPSTRPCWSRLQHPVVVSKEIVTSRVEETVLKHHFNPFGNWAHLTESQKPPSPRKGTLQYQKKKFLISHEHRTDWKSKLWWVYSQHTVEQPLEKTTQSSRC